VSVQRKLSKFYPEGESPVIRPPKITDWLATGTFWVSFILVMLFFDLLQRVTYPLGKQFHQWVMHGLNLSVLKILRLIGTRFYYRPMPEIPEDRPLIVVSNHQAIFDIPILFCAFHSHHPRFIAKKELSRWIPSASFHLRHGGNAVIDRGDPEQALPEIRALGDRIQQSKHAALIFPEGTRAKDGRLKRFKTKGIETLLEAAPDALLVPVTIDGTWRHAAHNFFPIPAGLDVDVVVGSPVQVSQETSIPELVDTLEQEIANTLIRLRATSKAA